ncbi:Protein translocase subunit SecA [Buchnera aphidicola (Neophyllaphis podocarpi)]
MKLIKFLSKIFKNYSKTFLEKMYKKLNKINNLESYFKKMKDSDFKLKTIKLRNSLNNGDTLNSILPEAFAMVREASSRVFGMRHFDVQLIGGMVLNNQCIAEMRTGEGKTLTATLPAYLNALTGKGVHIVTMNDYLAKRDAERNRPLFEFLGLTVGINLSGMSNYLKRKSYSADITYATNNEYGFDYLRDNMIYSSKEKVQRNLHYALIDEVDSILIDEARTPLIISGLLKNNLSIYQNIDEIIPNLIRQDKEDSDIFNGNGHFSVDEKTKQINLTERGLLKIEKILLKRHIIKESSSLYSDKNIILLQHIISSLRAHILYTKNVDYIVKNDEVIIVDEHTGRTMPGRRWSDGLHQAIEAKEKVTIRHENQTLASTTFQNYFRLYEKLSGMTGTACTESFEFKSIYNLDTIIIPTNRPMIRNDMPDLVYITEKEKIYAIINGIKNCIKKQQPVLVGTISIEKSELISRELLKLGINHNVLNAKFHAKEADIISQAGKPGAVTIATNMAGRGTDIVLGGSLESELKLNKNLDKKQEKKIKKTWKKNHLIVLSAGGLHIIGTERHESRRIDNQLRGRSGRQGDNGSSQFYLSMEDSLMRIFASNKVITMMRKLGIKSGQSINHPWVTKAISNAQKRVENRNFEIRKQLLEYDNISNDQRCIIYNYRNQLINTDNINYVIYNILEDVINFVFSTHTKFNKKKDIIDIVNLKHQLKHDFNLNLPISSWFKKHKLRTVINRTINYIKLFLKYKEVIITSKKMRKLEKEIMLQNLDLCWKDHLSSMDYLRQGIHLRGYAQKDPKQEYKKESFLMFINMIKTLKYYLISNLSRLDVI